MSSECVVLGVAVLRRNPVDVEQTRVDEHADHLWQVARRGEVVENDPAADVAVRVEVPPAVVEEHDRARLVRAVPGRSVDPDAPRGAREVPARFHPELLDHAGFDARSCDRVGP